MCSLIVVGDILTTLHAHLLHETIRYFRVRVGLFLEFVIYSIDDIQTVNICLFPLNYAKCNINSIFK